jgi:tRNA U55 pseudouridine synthase TruB
MLTDVVKTRNAPDLWTYEMVVSAGTYVRALVRDLGAFLGCGAAVASLRPALSRLVMAVGTTATPGIRR